MFFYNYYFFFDFVALSSHFWNIFPNSANGIRLSSVSTAWWILVKNRLPRSVLFKVGNNQKYEGDRSGLYGVCRIVWSSIRCRYCWIKFALWGLALSWCSTQQFLSSRRFVAMCFLNCLGHERNTRYWLFYRERSGRSSLCDWKMRSADIWFLLANFFSRRTVAMSLWGWFLFGQRIEVVDSSFVTSNDTLEERRQYRPLWARTICCWFLLVSAFDPHSSDGHPSRVSALHLEVLGENRMNAFSRARK